MLPFDTIKDWSCCTDVDKFMDHVLKASDKLPSSNVPTDRKLQQVAKTSFDDQVRNTYEVVAKYLEENFSDNQSYIPNLQRLAENIEMVRVFAGSETEAIKKARERAEKIINVLQEKVDLQKIRLIASQYPYIPFVQAMVSEIETLYNRMIKETPNAQIITRQKINNLLQNIQKFAEIIQSLLKGQVPISQAALTKLTLNDFKSSPIIQPYLSGEKVLKEGTELEQVKDQMFKIAKEMEDSLTLSPSALKQKRLVSPISTTAVRKQAGLHESRREVQGWAKEQDQLQSFGSSINKVYKLKKADGTETVAFYKESTEKGANAEIMEELMWDSALVMGLEEQFVATTSTKLRTKEHFVDAGETVKTWNDTRSELVDKTVSGARKGSIQPAQEGVTLSEYQANTDPNKTPIQHSQLVKGVLATSLMGFFDAHGGNILIDPNGNIIFFDNASSMPHSNSCFLWGGTTLKCSFRSGLLNLPDTQTPLTAEDRQFIKAEIKKYKIKYQELKKFYENPVTRAKIRKLPAGWFETEQVLGAMHERIQRLEAATADSKITTLCDLALASQPNLRFHQAMTIIFYFADNMPCQHSNIYLACMDNLGSNSIDTCIAECSSQGIDPLIVKQWCDDPNLSFDQVIEKIFTNQNRIDVRKAFDHAIELVEQLKSSALPDFKDWGL